MPFTYQAMLNYARNADKAGKVGDSYTATFWQCQQLIQTAVMLVAKSYCRQTASVAEVLPGRRYRYRVQPKK